MTGTRQLCPVVNGVLCVKGEGEEGVCVREGEGAYVCCVCTLGGGLGVSEVTGTRQLCPGGCTGGEGGKWC